MGVDNARPSLRTEVLDALMAAQGITTKEGHARAFGMNRTYYFQIRSGQKEPGLRIAMRMAAVARTTVDALFERVPEAQS